MDVGVCVTFLAVFGFHFRMDLPEVFLVMEQFLAPFGIRPIVELEAQKPQGLASFRVPV